MDDALKQLLTLGRGYFEKKQYSQAEKYLTQVVEQNQYAVIAIGTGGPAVAWSTDYATAEQNALAACSAKGDFCTAQRWVFK